ncbi:MAG: type II toxin-antitoxin system VapC family toxin [Flavobacteriales bacterium]|jgi:tRNA(fMet)-specific endonuclease VapC|nr:type II toxin-antitoxin system VapC family toxin [Flavobacteriales bacterium]
MYLLDTNACIHFMRGKYGMHARVAAVGVGHVAISEITWAEMLFGVEKSEQQARNRLALDTFLSDFRVLPITPAIPIYAKERARLEAIGKPLDDFDLLIGATAIHHGLALVTNNTRHFERLHGIVLEDWTA